MTEAPVQPIPKPLSKFMIIVALLFLVMCCGMVFVGVSSSYEMHKTSNLRQIIKDNQKFVDEQTAARAAAETKPAAAASKTTKTNP